MTANTVSVKQVASDKSAACTMDFTVPADAKVLCDGKPIHLVDIKKGSSVAVTFSTRAGQLDMAVTQVEVCKPCTQ